MRCLSCRETSLVQVFRLDAAPFADRLLDDQSDLVEEPRAPLDLRICPNCLLLQLVDAPTPQFLFGAPYSYLSGTSHSLHTHQQRLADELMAGRKSGNQTLVVEIAANDGSLLEAFRDRGARVLGIEPTPIPGSIARERGIEIIDEFFNESLAEQLAADGMRANIVLANNVLAHVPDPASFVRGLKKLLQTDGTISIEVAWVGDMIQRGAFDTVYHQHRCYFSLIALEPLIVRSGLSLRSVEIIPLQGASLRLTLDHGGAPDRSVDRVRREEAERELNRTDTYVTFGKTALETAGKIRNFIRRLKESNARVAAYGAAAKGTTLLHAAELGRAEIDYVVDKNPQKVGRFMPGNGIPIRPTEVLENDLPDYTLLLAWNYVDEIVVQEAKYIERGGRLILPIPSPRIVP